MRILQINAVYGQGSTGVIVKDLHELALSKGIEAHVAYSLREKSEIKNGYQIGTFFDKKLHAFFCRIKGKQAYNSRFTTYLLKKEILKIKPDVVHLHNLHSNYLHLNSLLKFLAKENFATVITFHDCWFFTGGCFHYSFINCDKWKNGCLQCVKSKGVDTKIKIKNTDKVLKDRKKYLSAIKNLTVVGCSEWMSQQAKQSFLKDKNVVTIKNGIDLDFFKFSSLKIKQRLGLEKDFVILAAANKWLRKENYNGLIDIAKKIPEDSKIVLLGCNDEQKKICLPNNIIKFDYVSNREELRDVYSMADVFINATREDTLPTINLEVQACGVPVITFDNTGAKETVEDVFCVKTGDFEEMLKKIISIKNGNKIELSRKCREFVCKNFDKFRNFEKYFDIYFKIG